MKKRFKNTKDMIKASVSNTIKRSNVKQKYWDDLLSKVLKPTKFDIFWMRFQLWKRQNQSL